MLNNQMVYIYIYVYHCIPNWAIQDNLSCILIKYHILIKIYTNFIGRLYMGGLQNGALPVKRSFMFTIDLL
jgi:hypothetical protein